MAEVHAALAALSVPSGAASLPGVPALPLPGAPAPPIPGAPVPPMRAAAVPPSRAALPFQPPDEDTFDPAQVSTGLPFVGAPKPPTPSGLPFSSAVRDDATKTPREEPGAAAVAASGMPFVQPRTPGMTIGEMVAQSRAPLPAPVINPAASVHIEAPGTFVPESTKDILPAGEAPPPPALLGPLATPEMVAAEQADEPTGDAAFADTGEGEPAAASQAAPEPEAPKEPEPLPLDKFPIDKCARIAASIARTREKESSILQAHELRQDVWERLKTHYAAEIKKETERGKTAQLRAYDAAYVAQLEEERGPIAVEEYARLVVAAERGTAPETLSALSLPDGAMLRIQRVWMIKMGQDPELRRLVRSAVELKSDE
ncbi:MAG: hypothetical protein IPK82_28995 [Polyangiaceae bacterium]|nr:hypothetical protein [Polyangiaceae bacterium]